MAPGQKASAAWRDLPARRAASGAGLLLHDLEPADNRLADVGDRLLARASLREAPGHRRDLGDVETVLVLFNHHANVHRRSSRKTSAPPILYDIRAGKQSWQNRLTGVQMALEAEVAKRRTHLEAVQLAEKQFRPSSPKLLYVLGLALAGGLAFGGAVVFLSNTLDRSISATQDAAKHFNLPVCGVIDEIVTPGERLWGNVRRFIAEPAIALILVGVIGVAGLNIALWLHYPEEHKQWQEDPTAFVGSRATYYYQRGVQKLKQSF